MVLTPLGPGSLPSSLLIVHVHPPLLLTGPEIIHLLPAFMIIIVTPLAVGLGLFSEGTPRSHGIGEGTQVEPVVFQLGLVVPEDFVGIGDLLEPLAGIRGLVDIRMEFLGEVVIRRFDV